MEPPVNGGVGRMSSFGEGIKVTPLQLAALMGAFANGGRLYYLQYPRTPEELEAFRPRVKRHLPIQRWLPELRAGMEAAVVYGTAHVSTASFSEGQMLGKTGTCGEDKAKLGWFASYGELPNGKKVAVVVLLRGGRAFSGSKAAQIAAEIYKGLADSRAFAASSPAGPSSLANDR
jgi:cell division protein FtsI/penicillin-binding protein 2